MGVIHIIPFKNVDTYIHTYIHTYVRTYIHTYIKLYFVSNFRVATQMPNWKYILGQEKLIKLKHGYCSHLNLEAHQSLILFPHAQ